MSGATLRRIKYRCLIIVLLICSVFSTGNAVAQQAEGKPGEPPASARATAKLPSNILVSPDTQANRALLAGVRENDAAVVQAAFEQGASPNARWGWEPDPATNLIFAFIGVGKDGEPEQLKAISIFRQFLERGLDLKATDTSYQAFTGAMELEDVDLLRLLLDKGWDIKTVYPRPSPSGTDAVSLVMAGMLRNYEHRRLPLLKLVLERGADPNMPDDAGLTPLHRAAIFGLPRTAELLVNHGADVNVQTRIKAERPTEGFTSIVEATPLVLAARQGHQEIVRLLTAAKPSLTPVEAAATGNAAALRGHLDAGLDANSKDELGTPLLLLAAASGSEETVRLLLDRKADPNAPASQGTTALHRAANFGHAAVVRLLLERRGNPNAARGREDSPSTPLTLAIRASEADVVDILLERGVDLSAPGNRDALSHFLFTAGIHPMRTRGHPKRDVKEPDDLYLEAHDRIFASLIARMDVRRYGGKALCEAVDREQFKLAEVLIKKGADVNARNEKGETVTMLLVEAINMNRWEASPLGLGTTGARSPEEIAERKKEVAVVDAEALRFLRFLLQQRPDLSVVAPKGSDEEGKTALEIALEWKLNDVAALLKEAGARR